jgi:hypothetical protein
MPVFMVERYAPALEPDGVEAQARMDEALAQGAGPGVRHVRTTYSRTDELCFSFFEASSLDTLISANDLADMDYERIVEVIESVEPAANGLHTGGSTFQTVPGAGQAPHTD